MERRTLSGGHEWGTAPDFVGPRHEFRESLLLKLLLSARPSQQMLNVGAGQGSFTRMLEERGFDVVSTDLSPAALEVLRERVAGPVLQADMTNLPFPDESFDVVLAGEVIEHIDDDVAALREAHRVLRANGVLVLSVPAHPGWFGDSDRWAGHVRRYTRDALAETISSAGFDDLRIVPWGFPIASLYHRLLFDKSAAKLAGDSRPRRLQRALLKIGIQVDRLFVGTERGCLGYLGFGRAGQSMSPEQSNLRIGAELYSATP